MGTGVIAAEGGGNFLVTPNVGLMIWTLIAFGIALYVLKRLARQEADELLEEYRARLREAREQAEEIVSRSRRASERLQEDSLVEAKQQREELMERTRREIEQETRRALEDIRKEVANLTVLATEKLTRKSLDGEDQRRLVQEALSDIDFSQLAPEGVANGGSEN